MILSRIMALMLAFGIALTATADETINDLRRQTAGVRKIRQQAGVIDREVQAIRELMEASGVISEESLLAVKRISTEVDSAANQSLNKALVHIAEARDNIADTAPHIASAIREQDAAEKSLKDAHREATIQAQVSLLIDRLTTLRADLVALQQEARETHDSTLAGNAVDAEVIAEKQHRLADQLDPAQEASRRCAVNQIALAPQSGRNPAAGDAFTQFLVGGDEVDEMGGLSGGELGAGHFRQKVTGAVERIDFLITAGQFHARVGVAADGRDQTALFLEIAGGGVVGGTDIAAVEDFDHVQFAGDFVKGLALDRAGAVAVEGMWHRDDAALFLDGPGGV